MTLFKRVFNKRSPDTGTLLPEEGIGFHDMKDSAEEATLRSVAGAVKGQQYERHRPADDPDRDPAQASVPGSAVWQDMAPAAPSKGADVSGGDMQHPAMTMAERAALAQQQIAASLSPAFPETPGSMAQSPRQPVADTEFSARSPLDGVPAPTQGRAGRRVGPAKTRLMRVNQEEDKAADPFVNAPISGAGRAELFPVAWLVVIDGPGAGHSFAIYNGVSVIGRGDDQVIKLDFGDTAISRQNHAALAYDEEQNKFYLGHGGKSNIIRLRDRPVLSTEEVCHGDLIRIAETTLRLVALCGSDFKWDQSRDTDAVSI